MNDILKLFGLILPWALTAFLAGLLLGLWNGDQAVFSQYEERLAEAQMRDSVNDHALNLLAKDRYQKRDALVGAVRAWRKEKDAAKP